MDKKKEFDWDIEKKDMSKFQIQGNLDESDAHLYQ